MPKVRDANSSPPLPASSQGRKTTSKALSSSLTSYIKENDLDVSIDIPILADIDHFLRSFPELCDQYLPISKLGEGTFSTVYKAIDLNHDLHENDYWLNASLQDEHEEMLQEITKFKKFIENPELFSPISEVPIEATRIWRERMKEYLEDFEEAVKKGERICYVALKRINMTSSPERTFDEIEFIKSLGGTCDVVPIITALRYQDQVVVVMPYFKHSDFRDYLPVLSMEDIKYYLYALVKSIEHVHRCGIIHRDLKPSNFLYSVKHQRGLLVDFGLAQKDDSKDIEASNHANNIRKKKIPMEPISTKTVQNEHLKMSKYQPGYYINDHRPNIKASRAGTRGFRAPEVLFKYADQTNAIDMWSIGVIFLTVLTKKYPFFHSPDDTEAIIEIANIFGNKNMIKAGLFYDRVWHTNVPSVSGHALGLKGLVESLNPREYSQIPEEAFDLLAKCLTLNFKERVSAKDALCHPYFDSIREAHCNI